MSAATSVVRSPAHVTSVLDWDAEQIGSLFELASWIADQPSDVTRRLAPGALVGSCFYQNSTRTRLSFEAATHRLGGSTIGFADAATTRAGDFFAESLEDTIRIVSGYVDLVILRHVRDDAAEVARAVSSVPVISAGAGEREHPTQGLLDTWSLTRVLGQVAGLRLGLVGDPGCRSLRSILFAACRLGVSRLMFLPVPGTTVTADESAVMTDAGATWEVVESADELLDQVDAVSMIPFDLPDFHVAAAPGTSRRTDDPRFVFSAEMLRRHRSVPVVHSGPRGIELPGEATELDQVHYFDGVRHGVSLRAALLCRMLGRA